MKILSEPVNQKLWDNFTEKEICCKRSQVNFNRIGFINCCALNRPPQYDMSQSFKISLSYIEPSAIIDKSLRTEVRVGPEDSERLLWGLNGGHKGCVGIKVIIF